MYTQEQPAHSEVSQLLQGCVVVWRRFKWAAGGVWRVLVSRLTPHVYPHLLYLLMLLLDDDAVCGCRTTASICRACVLAKEGGCCWGQSTHGKTVEEHLHLLGQQRQNTACAYLCLVAAAGLHTDQCHRRCTLHSLERLALCCCLPLVQRGPAGPAVAAAAHPGSWPCAQGSHRQQQAGPAGSQPQPLFPSGSTDQQCLVCCKCVKEGEGESVSQLLIVCEAVR